jgi:hypothetical protein
MEDDRIVEITAWLCVPGDEVEQTYPQFVDMRKADVQDFKRPLPTQLFHTSPDLTNSDQKAGTSQFNSVLICNSRPTV